MIKLTKRIKDTIEEYGKQTCIDAYREHLKGSGGNTVGWAFIDNTSNLTGRQVTIIGDKLIDSGRYIIESLKQK